MTSNSDAIITIREFIWEIQIDIHQQILLENELKQSYIAQIISEIDKNRLSASKLLIILQGGSNTTGTDFFFCNHNCSSL